MTSLREKSDAGLAEVKSLPPRSPRQYLVIASLQAGGQAKILPRICRALGLVPYSPRQLSSPIAGICTHGASKLTLVTVSTCMNSQIQG